MKGKTLRRKRKMSGAAKTMLNWDVNTLFLFLGQSTMFLNEKQKHRVFNDMAYKLMEWENTPRHEVRAALAKHDIPFEERCAECGEDIEPNDEEHPLCDECKLKK